MCTVEWGHRQLKDDWRAAELLPIARSSWMRRTVLPGIFAPRRSTRSETSWSPNTHRKRGDCSPQVTSTPRLPSEQRSDAYPADPRLRAILDALTKESDRRRGRTSDRTADLETLASPTPRTSEAVAPREDQTVSARTDSTFRAAATCTASVMLDSTI